MSRSSGPAFRAGGDSVATGRELSLQDWPQFSRLLPLRRKRPPQAAAHGRAFESVIRLERDS
jgi:hypothetical protein